MTMMGPEKQNAFRRGWQWAVVICEGEEEMYVLWDYYNCENNAHWVSTVSLSPRSVITHVPSKPHSRPGRRVLLACTFHRWRNQSPIAHPRCSDSVSELEFDSRPFCLQSLSSLWVVRSQLVYRISVQLVYRRDQNAHRTKQWKTLFFPIATFIIILHQSSLSHLNNILGRSRSFLVTFSS